MKRQTAAIALILIVLASWSAYSFLPDYLTSKMQKQVCKLFGSSVLCVELPIPDTSSINHKYFKLSDNDSLVGYVIISRALGCQIEGCDKPSKDSLAFEQFYFMTAFDHQKNIKKVRILEYTSNHGYQIANKAWLKQFENGSFFEVGKNIDGISGATISVKSITKEVNNQIKIIKHN